MLPLCALMLLLATRDASARLYGRSHSASRRGTFNRKAAIRAPLQKPRRLARSTNEQAAFDALLGVVDISRGLQSEDQAWLDIGSSSLDSLSQITASWSSSVPSSGPAIGPICLDDIDSVTTVVQDSGEIIEGVSTLPATTGISSFDLLADNLVLEMGYFVDIQLGTPPKTFRMQIDTSSADTWVSSESCATCAISHGKLGPSSSSSFILAAHNRWTTPDSYSASYLFSGVSDLTNVSGVSCNDTMTVAGLTLPTMAFGVATEVENEYSADWLPFDGVLGLANSQIFPPLSLQNIGSPIVQLASAGLIPRAQVGIDVGRATRAGQLALGGVDPSLFQGPMHTVPSISRLGYWEAAFDISVAGRASFGFTNRSAIFDSRSASILAPASDIAALQLNSGADGRVVLPCKGSGLILTFTFGGRRFSIPPSDLILLPVMDQSCSSPPCCLSALQPAPAALALTSRQWVVGTAALKSIYLGLDYETFSIGLAAIP